MPDIPIWPCNRFSQVVTTHFCHPGLRKLDSHFPATRASSRFGMACSSPSGRQSLNWQQIVWTISCVYLSILNAWVSSCCFKFPSLSGISCCCLTNSWSGMCINTSMHTLWWSLDGWILEVGIIYWYIEMHYYIDIGVTYIGMHYYIGIGNVYNGMHLYMHWQKDSTQDLRLKLGHSTWA